ncbi:hypothetical protein IU500_06710 [Nocardia terpenica]|uniref:hypothetical protein n=1 Tax=Nocardia terpenica TaxID=455432 RepID=UPI001895C4BC|nr:hypothetical protein [Nocardia terpenica]MBF6060469.1 hypothetical protein [Nocardia terpenica]MBF6103729.1 hypothetical protein [Nocardia terpenica]MBF6111897.1 hypothetical protein [Nocardia terpenica]MBF6117950.1 hypothetical protein [Nocardia terpenica]MBF6155324.1 hypothetical protein [Nocardia terpenica]
MTIILVTTLISLLLFVTAVVGRVADHGVSDNTRHMKPRLTVADIQARLAAEPPHTYVPISRGW